MTILKHVQIMAALSVFDKLPSIQRRNGRNIEYQTQKQADNMLRKAQEKRDRKSNKRKGGKA